MAGVCRIHFVNRTRHPDAGPLTREQTHLRSGELKAMIASLTATRPYVREIHGHSWLYNKAAYTRLFPPSYVATARINRTTMTFSGFSLWGQFLSSTGVKIPACEAFLQGLKQFRIEQAWRAFPLALLELKADIEVFRAHFEKSD